MQPERRLILMGWALFAVCGVFYLVSAIRAGDPWAIAGVVTWEAAILMFLLAMRRSD